MIVKVEACNAGGDTYQRLTIPQSNGQSARERINSESWNRAAEREALSLLENVYHIKRKTVRFQIH